MELRLARLQEDPPSLEACTRPAEPLMDFPEIEGRPQIQAVHRAMTDLMVMALACDQTRVFSHWFSDPLTNKLYPEATAGHHSLTHDEPGSQPEVNMITKFVMGELNYMIERLASIEEGDETFDLQIDGETVDSFNVADGSVFNYQSADTVTADQIRVRFTNDLWDPPPTASTAI